MSAIQALQLWCKQQCEGYKDVSVTNMTTSFRDGLAFCAILHRHRPDLINFTSLSKENVFENNELAFQVAEKELGIPALLDAEDMVALKVPDRLSILTYVSQYYNYFHGKSPIGGMAGIKRPASQPSEQPTGKKMISEPTAPSFTKPARQPSPLESKTEPAAPGHSPMVNASPRRVLAEKSNTPHSNCAVCGAHVHLVQRLLVDGKLYHRNCFRCKECSRTLQRGNYTAGLGPGAFLCSQHAGPAPAQGPPAQEIHGEKDPPKTAPGNSGMGLEPMPAASPGVKPSWAFRNNNATRPAAWEPSDSKNNKTSSPSLHRWDPPDQTADQPSTSPSTGSRLKIQQAREKFFQADPPPASFPAGKAEPVRNHSSPFKPSQVPEKTALSRMQVPSHSEKDQARSILSRVLPGPQPSTSQPGAVGSASPRSVASKGNPLPPGSSGSRSPQPQNFLVSRPLNKPAFAEAAGVTETHHPVANLPKDPSYKVGVRADPQNKAKDRSLGPSVNSGRKSDTKVAKARSANVVEEKLGSPEDWRSRLKPVKLPHQVETKTSPKSEDVHKVVINKEVKPGQKDKKPSLSVVSPAVPKAVPLAFQPQKKKLLVPQLDVSSSWQTVKQPWESHPSTAQAGRRNLSKKVVATDQPSAPGTFRKPPSDQALSPTQRHPDYVPEEEIQKEVQRIERDLDRLEQKGISLEKQLRGCEGDDSEDVLMVEWFKLIHEKQLLLRWESELMHKMNQQKLEVKQWDIESELRNLMSKADYLKTPREKAREKELLDSYLDTVNDRNKIVEDLDEDRLRELEEDEMMAAMIKSFGMSQITQENEKKKTKFGLFRILKTKS
ncbi:MICAL-like protein 2 [Candoia aspera]|uniref:MICAL-like protein 2 n=1 Tax=Candoia aspera TaxID=51853 RepID=UPI002FD7CDA0